MEYDFFLKVSLIDLHSYQLVVNLKLYHRMSYLDSNVLVFCIFVSFVPHILNQINNTWQAYKMSITRKHNPRNRPNLIK